MNSLCDQVSQRILDPEGPELNPQEELHARSCAVCRELAAEVERSAAYLETASRAGGGVALLSPRLKASVYEKSIERIETIRSEESPRREPMTALLGWLGFGPERSPRAAYAWGALFVLVIVGGAYRWTADQRPVGRVDFAMGGVEVRRGSISGVHDGLLDLELRSGSLVRTTEDSEAFIELGGGGDVRVALGRATSLRILGPDRIEVQQGAVWLSVNPAGRGFEVVTPSGVVRVTGTVFGVSTDVEGTFVDVTEGTVRVSYKGEGRSVSAGFEARAGKGTVTEPTARAEGTAVPAWVGALHAEETRAAKASYLPSVTK